MLTYEDLQLFAKKEASSLISHLEHKSYVVTFPILHIKLRHYRYLSFSISYSIDFEDGVHT